jgi:hypothetical protein
LPPDATHRVFPLPSGEYGAWIAQARHLPVFTCDAVFRIESSVYIGPDNGMTEPEWETANIRLPPLDLPRQFVDRVTTAEALDREDALISHYRRIVAVVETHGKSTSLQSFPYFRTQPTIIASDEVLTEFSWNDNIHETQAVLEILTEADGGAPRSLHDDQDQGWHILIVATDAGTCFIEWDAEGPPPIEGGYAVDAAELARQAGAAFERLRIIHDRLVQALGQDYWTYRHSPPRVPPTNPIRSAVGRLFRINARSRLG